MLSFSTMVAGTGFVLAGGASSRMGRNKALMPLGRTAMVHHVARTVAEVAGSVVLVGQPEIYQELGFPVVADPVPDFGPVAGLAGALGSDYTAEWNLVVACDMPAVTPALLRRILDAATDQTDCVIPQGPSGRPEPLCALYRRTCFAAFQSALDQQIHKVMQALSSLRVLRMPVPEAHFFTNLNTLEEFNTFDRTRVAEE